MTAPTIDRRSAPIVVSARTGGARLTPREREVVALAREGSTSEDIGGRLGIPTRTAGALLRDARRKLAAHEPRGREALLRRWPHGRGVPRASARTAVD